MRILVVNSGSASLKCQLIDMENREVIVKGIVDKIGGHRAKIKEFILFRLRD